MEPSWHRIRPLALGIFRRGDDILVDEAWDEVKQELFYRPPGGAIEYGELGAEALVREMREELQAEIAPPRYIATVENVFTYNGEVGHEIVQVFDARFLDESLYQKDELATDEAGWTGKAVWRPLADFAPGGPPLYPDGLYELLQRPGYVRPVALAIFRRGDEILVTEDYSPATGRPFARPLGGTIEFGERAEEALRREMREELGIELAGVRQLAVLESIFTYTGWPRHDLVFVFQADFADPGLYHQDWAAQPGADMEARQARWRPLDRFRRGETILFPEGLLELLG